ncbi:MAG: hypothetical protein G01um101417_436 [Parcubacteria group bacterium Gr01-1014_17]|nr:MAG: hypothetical protein G01um101417_436 [Parcubacteria group bacterium Gr01-1014_17]
MENNEVPRIRTYERDVEEFMKKEQGTAAKFALAEQSRRIAMVGTPTSNRSVGASGERGMTKNPPPRLPIGGQATPSFIKEGERGRISSISIPSPEIVRQIAGARSLVVWSILFLFFAGAVGIGYWYISNWEQQETVPARVGTAKIILSDKEKALDATRLTRDTFISAFARERDAALALSSFTIFTPTKTEPDTGRGTTARALTTSKFLSLLDTSAPGELVRALGADFALGIRGLPTNSAFLIFKTNYFQTALAGMLKWEKTMLNDVGPLFGTAIGGTIFTDRTIKNRDVRELLDGSGKPLLLYGFADKQTIIIADDEDTFEKTMERLVRTP